MDRSQSDPNWPVNYPAIVRQDFTPTQNIPGFIHARNHDEVKVTSKIDFNGNICIQYPIDDQGRPGRRGWVSSQILQIGTTRKIGDPLLVEVGGPFRPFLAQNVNPQKGSLLHRTVSGLLASYYEHREDLPTRPDFIDKLLDSENPKLIENLARKIIVGVGSVSKSLLDLLNSGDFDAIQIRDASWDASKSPKTGIYLIIYSDYPGEPGRMEVYVGSTGWTFEGRYQHHVYSRRKVNPKGVHYRSAAKARKHQVFPVCLMENLYADHLDLKIAEQVFVDLFQTTCSAVLNFQSWVDTDDDHENEVPSQISANEEILTRVGKYLVDKDEAIILLDLAQQVFSRTGWPGGVLRTTGKPFLATAGLNWKMPLTEMRHTRTTWTQTSVAGKYLNFRRTGCTVRSVTGPDGKIYKSLWSKARIGGGQFTFPLPQNISGPDIGTKIDVIFEIRIDGQTHPCQYARAPTVGCFEDWHDATTLAMRIEWQDRNGVWFYRYVQLDQSYGHVAAPGAPDGATMPYALATGLRAFFLHETRRPTTEFPWIYEFGYARIKEITVNHLTQTVKARQIHNPHPPPAPMRRRSLDSIGQELVNLGAYRYAKETDEKFPKFRDGARLTGPKGGFPRKSCDRCHAGRIIGKHSWKHLKCDKVPGVNQCTQCKRLRRPCTFTEDVDLLNNEALVAASINPAIDERGVQPVGNRMMERF